MLAKISILFLLATPLMAETRVYLVKRAEHFPLDRYATSLAPLEFKMFRDAGKRDIKSAGGQPFQITSYVLNFNGRYALWATSSNDSDEIRSEKSMVDKGYVILLETLDVAPARDVRAGGDMSVPVHNTLASMPTDYYQIEVSTGI